MGLYFMPDLFHFRAPMNIIENENGFFRGVFEYLFKVPKRRRFAVVTIDKYKIK